MTEMPPPALVPRNVPQNPQRPFPLRASLRAISALMLRDMASKYGRTPGGYVWVIAEPLGMIVVLSFAFSLIAKTPPIGSSFLLFYATGVLPFGYYGELQNAMLRMLKQSRNLLTYPVVSWIDAVIARLILSTLTQLLVSYLVMTGIFLFIDVHAVIDVGALATSYLMAACIGVGVGLVNCVFAAFVPIWGTLWGIATRPMFLASGIIFLYNDMPQLAQDILWWNPLIHVTGLGRAAFFPTYDVTYVSHTFVFGTGIGLTALGLLLVKRFHKRILAR